jgi:hypothetical protein
MRIAGLAAALVVSGWVTAPAAQSLEMTAPNPASVVLTIWCSRFPDAACRQVAADEAQATCRAVGAQARFVRSALLQRSFTHGQKGFFLYDCVPQGHRTSRRPKAHVIKASATMATAKGTPIPKLLGS